MEAAHCSIARNNVPGRVLSQPDNRVTRHQELIASRIDGRKTGLTCHRPLSRSGTDKHEVRHEKANMCDNSCFRLALHFACRRPVICVCVRPKYFSFSSCSSRSLSAERANTKWKPLPFSAFPSADAGKDKRRKVGRQLPVKRKKTVEQFLATHEENI
jgi:hypothetical protein